MPQSQRKKFQAKRMRFCILLLCTVALVTATPQTWNIMNDILDQ